jgi:catechol 2,3-dioxygenase-like lactoylglutathione lyase family enzyme
VTVAHVAVNVGDWASAKQFYEAVLGPLGYRVVYEEPGALAYLADAGGLDFGLGRRDPVGGAHVAFECPDRETVDRFHEIALGAGGRDNGAPGIRAQYDANYYAAYVLDPDGNNIEAVCHRQPESS